MCMSVGAQKGVDASDILRVAIPSRYVRVERAWLASQSDLGPLPTVLPAIYGAEYASAVDAARVILLYAFLQFAFPWTKNFAAVIGRPRVQSTLAALMFAVAVTVILSARQHGATAAAAGLSAGALAMTVGYVLVAHRYFAELRPGSARAGLPGA